MSIKEHLIVPIPVERQGTRTWQVLIDGVHIEQISHIVVRHAAYGTFAYGMTPHGYDGWSFRESSGGGVVILPYIEHGGVLYVGVIEQHRPNLGGLTLNAPRGFIDVGETPLAAAARELAEELALEVDEGRLRPLPGAPANPNSAFFETPGPGQGVRFFAIELGGSEVVVDGEGIRINPELAERGSARDGRAAERITRARLLPWREAAGLSDMLTNAAVARLLSAVLT